MSQKIKNLFVIPRYWPSMGGAELHTRQLAKVITPEVDVSVMTHCSTETEPPEIAFARNHSFVTRKEGITVHQYAVSHKHRQTLSSLSRYHEQYRVTRPLYAHLQKRDLRPKLQALVDQVDIVHGVYNGSTATMELAAELARKSGKPFVWTPLAHTTLPAGTGWSSRQFKRLYQRADALITMTHYEKNWLVSQGADKKRITVCPVAPLLSDSADPHAFRQRYQLDDKPFVLFLGRLAGYKGYQELCAAGEKIWREHPDCQLVFIGPHTEESRQFFASQNDARIRYLGMLEDEEKTSAIAACQMLCVPSTEESLGVTYLEAWHYAKPVIAADIPVLRTVISHENDGLLCAPDAEGISDAVLQLLNNPYWAELLGIAGRNKVRRDYHWPNLGKRLVTVYQQLLDKKSLN